MAGILSGIIDEIGGVAGKVPAIGPGTQGFLNKVSGGISSLFEGGDFGGTGALLLGLAGLGQKLIDQGVSEDQLQLQRDQFDALEKQRGFENAFAQEKIKLELGIAAINAAKEAAAPDRTLEMQARQAQIQQGGKDTDTQIRALEAAISGIVGALK